MLCDHRRFPGPRADRRRGASAGEQGDQRVARRAAKRRHPASPRPGHHPRRRPLLRLFDRHRTRRAGHRVGAHVARSDPLGRGDTATRPAARLGGQGDSGCHERLGARHLVRQRSVPALLRRLNVRIEPALVADATKILAEDKEPSENREIDPKRTALVTSAEAFMDAIRGKTPSACDALTGFRATVVAITANQAITENKRIAFQPEWFAL